MSSTTKLYRGDAFWVSFGGYGRQLAVVYDVRGRVLVQKYRRSSGRWTQPVVVLPGDVATHRPRRHQSILAAAGVPPSCVVSQEHARRSIRAIAREGAA